MTLALALSACSSSDTPTPEPSPSASTSADPLRNASLLLDLMRGEVRLMNAACNPPPAPDDRACGERIEKTAAEASRVRSYLSKIPSNEKVAKLDEAMAKVEKSVEDLRKTTCYGLSTPPSPDIDRASKQQVCTWLYAALIASVSTATDRMSYG
jgi:hypothetical protein